MPKKQTPNPHRTPVPLLNLFPSGAGARVIAADASVGIARRGGAPPPRRGCARGRRLGRRDQSVRRPLGRNHGRGAARPPPPPPRPARQGASRRRPSAPAPQDRDLPRPVAPPHPEPPLRGRVFDAAPPSL